MFKVNYTYFDHSLETVEKGEVNRSFGSLMDARLAAWNEIEMDDTMLSVYINGAIEYLMD